jgi:hypothetical protein
VCPVPQLQRKTFKALGTPTVQAAALSDEFTELTQEELLDAAVKRRTEVRASQPILPESCPRTSLLVVGQEHSCLMHGPSFRLLAARRER